MCVSYFIVRPIFYAMLTNSIKLIKNPRVSNWKRLRLITNLRASELYFVYVFVYVASDAQYVDIIMVHSLEKYILLTSNHG